MNTFLRTLMLLLIPALLSAQFAVVSTQPANNAVNVPLTVTLSITFSEALDTVAMEETGEGNWFTNIDSATSHGYSADAKTAWSTHVLKPNTDYFYAFSYVKAKSGALITTPHVYYFTTGSAFAPNSVSGTLSAGTVNIPPAGSVVALSTVNFMEEETDGPPPFGGWANVNANGTFTIPHVANGTYWPLAAKDVNGNGQLDPGRDGDVVVMGDSIVVNNANITNLSLTFFSLLSVQPANLSVNVPLQTTLSLTFSEPIDMESMEEAGETWFSSIDSLVESGVSNNGKTIWSTVVLKPNTPYFISFMHIRARSGSVMNVPQIYYFTTGAAFPTTTVSGMVLSGTTGESAEGAVVGLAKVNFLQEKTDGTPPFGGWGMVNANGTFTIPYVPNGTYWPLAAKDVNKDGELNPDNGIDVMAFGDSIVVNNASVTGVELTFFKLTPFRFDQVIQRADSLAAVRLPADRSLRRISGWDVDTLGRARSWEFAYSVNNNTAGKTIQIGTMDMRVEDMDPQYFQWIGMMKPVTGYQQAASSATVIANVEAAGGKQVRMAQIPPQWEFRIELSLSNQSNGWFGGSQDIDTSKSYWAVAYTYNFQFDPNHNEWMGGMLYLCDLQTGAILKSQPVMGPFSVRKEPAIADQYTLAQNYPNPFNPSTTIRFSLPAAGMATLTVYDMLGKEVSMPVNEPLDAGTYSVPFNGTQLPSGVYFYRLRAGVFTETRKMLLMK